MEIFEQIYKAIVERNEADVIRLSNELLQKDIDPIQAIEKGYRRGMEKIGDQFEKLEIYLPEMIQCADIMKKGIAIIRPALKKSQAGGGKILLGTIEGDVHDIGKNIVKIVLEGSGFEVIDLGKDVKILTFVDKCKELKPDILAISALLTTTMENIPKVIEDLERVGLKSEIKIMVGGAPVLPDWAKKIGADGSGENASQAVSLAKEWLEHNK